MKSRVAFTICLSLVVVSLMASLTHAGPISNPTAIPGSQLWLDGNDVDGDGIPEGGSESFTPLGTATWVDKSSAGTNHAKQVTTNLQPTVVPGGLNSKAIVRFDGGADTAGDYLSMPDFASGFTSATGFIVFVANGNSLDPSYTRNGGAWNLGGSSGNNHFGVGQVYDDFGNSNRPLIQNSISEATPYVYTAIVSGGQFTPLLNGTIGDGAAYPLAVTQSWSTTPTIGQSLAYKYNGDVAEAIIYNRVLSDGTLDQYDNELNDVWFYLQEKWALDLGLEATPVFVAPEPSSALLLGLGLLGLAKVRRRRRK